MTGTSPFARERQLELCLERVAVDDETGCWVWTGPVMAKYGYARASDGTGARFLVHRFVYESLVAAIPDGHDVHHLCRRRACVNPEHLTTLPSGDHWRLHLRERVERQRATTHCSSGHEFTPGNTFWEGARRRCRECRRAFERTRVRDRKKAAA